MAADLTQTPASPANSRTLFEWTFDRANDLQGWSPNSHLTDVKVASGTLAARADGPDPILELQPLLNIPASPWQQIEIRIKADHDGISEFFWSNTAHGQYGGFSQEKSTRFNVVGDGQWRVCRLLPFWHPEGKIVRLRFDPHTGASFSIDYIRVVEIAMPSASPTRQLDFDFSQGAHGWQAINGATLVHSSDGLRFACNSRDALLLAPPLDVPADKLNFVSIILAASEGHDATILFATDKTPGLHTFTFPIEADGQEHRYNLDLLDSPGWRGRILALALRLSVPDSDIESSGPEPWSSHDAAARLRSLTIAAGPSGPPELKVLAFAPDEALPRSGMPIRLRAAVANRGGRAASNIQAEIRIPNEVRLLASPTNVQIESLEFGEEAAFNWTIQAARPLRESAEIIVSSTEGARATARTTLDITAPIATARFDYVPEPRPVRGPWEVGVYYFPGWHSASQWHPLERFPERKPLLGWYREGDPEVADWHIKWAVEHGITFFAYDWYWSQGSRQLEHALHDGYFRARYRSLLKFCLLWANHNAPNTSSLEDCLAVTRYWIQNYFRRQEYLRVEDKPVMIIFSTERLTADLGSEGVRNAIAEMRAECGRAGLPGLYLMACVADAGQARAAAAEGYDAVTAYTWPGLGLQSTELSGPYESLLEGYRRNWLHIISESPIPLALPICGGWDSRPWHGHNNIVRFGRTPDLFRRHLEDAKRTLQSQSTPRPPSQLLLIEAWNEWGEGSYIEPHREFGFGYLDAIRQVFTDATEAHIDITPADLRLGPYDVPAQDLTRTKWDFARGFIGWENTMDMAGLRLEQKAMAALTTGRDPAFFSPPIQARAREFSTVFIRMKLARTDGKVFTDSAQLFWRTDRLPESEASSKRFDVLGDGKWHEYRIAVAQSARWRGIITRLRLDPVNQPGVAVSLSQVRLDP
jgi:hypothetical protein